jgi:hypothetical protein
LLATKEVKAFFFEKKKQKTFVMLSQTHDQRTLKKQKFFGSADSTLKRIKGNLPGRH